MQHYIDLNDPYVEMNAESFKKNQTDYAPLMGLPQEQAPSMHDATRRKSKLGDKHFYGRIFGTSKDIGETKM